MAIVSVNRPRGGERVAWRAWAASPKLHSGRHEWFLDEALSYMIGNHLLAIGYGDEPLAKRPPTWAKFSAATGYPPNVFWFARRMKKGDLVVLARNRGHIAAYGYLKDDDLRYVDAKHPLARTLARMHEQSRAIYASLGYDGGEFESYTNYRLIDRWIPFKGAPKTKNHVLDGNIRTTVAAVPIPHALKWLGLKREPAAGFVPEPTDEE